MKPEESHSMGLFSDGKTEETVECNEETLYNLFEDIRVLKEEIKGVKVWVLFGLLAYESSTILAAFSDLEKAKSAEEKHSRSGNGYSDGYAIIELVLE